MENLTSVSVVCAFVEGVYATVDTSEKELWGACYWD